MPFFGKSKIDAIKQLYTLDLDENEVGVLYLGLSGVIIRVGDKTIALDISDMLGKKEAEALQKLDYLLYTHGHYDHYNLRSCMWVFEETNTRIIAESSVYRELRGRIPSDNLIEAKEGDTIKFDDFNISVIRGVHVGPIVLYLMDSKGIKVFHGGDSGYVPLRGYSADLAFIPTGKPSPTASPNDALRMSLDLKPRVIVPIHGAKSEHEEFERLIENNLPTAQLVIINEFEARKISL